MRRPRKFWSRRQARAGSRKSPLPFLFRRHADCCLAQPTVTRNASAKRAASFSRRASPIDAPTLSLQLTATLPPFPEVPLPQLSWLHHLDPGTARWPNERKTPNSGPASGVMWLSPAEHPPALSPYQDNRHTVKGANASTSIPKLSSALSKFRVINGLGNVIQTLAHSHPLVH